MKVTSSAVPTAAPSAATAGQVSAAFPALLPAPANRPAFFWYRLGASVQSTLNLKTKDIFDFHPAIICEGSNKAIKSSGFFKNW